MRFLLDIRQDIPILYEITDAYVLKSNLQQEKRIFTSQKIIHYIENATPVRVVLDEEDCLICKHQISDRETLVSDGNWVWSDHLVHYTKNHSLKLPEQFYSHLNEIDLDPTELSMEKQKEIFMLFKVYSDDYGLMKSKIKIGAIN